MFGKNPYDRVDPFVSKFEMLKYNTTNIGQLAKYQKRQKQKGRNKIKSSKFWLKKFFLKFLKMKNIFLNLSEEKIKKGQNIRQII